MTLFKKKKLPLQPDLRTMLSEFNRSLMLIVDKSLLISNVIAKIKQISSVESVYIFLLDQSTGKYKLQNETENRPLVSFNEKDRLISWLSVNDKELLVSLYPDVVNYFSIEERDTLTKLDTELIYPLKVMNHISGTILLGSKTDKTHYTEEEINILSLLFDQAAFALEHAMLYELQTERLKRMYRTDRLATLGELAAGAAHEIRNPLTAIRSTIQYVSKDFANDTVKAEMIREVLTEVERINKILQGLLSFARPSEINRSDVNIEQLVNQTLLLLNTSIQQQQIDIQFEYFTEETTLQGDAEQLKQVFLNMMLNAIEAMSSNDSDHLRTLIISIEKGAFIDTHNRYLIISIEDSGKGIEEKDIEKVFNPFFTTKEEGTGLGLAICYGIINRHKGDIEITSAEGKGTSIHIKLPQRI